MKEVEVADDLSLELTDGEAIAQAWRYANELAGSALAATWRYAAELVAQEDVWHGIERVADILILRQLDGPEILPLCCQATSERWGR
jgi:hypothetical protein